MKPKYYYKCFIKNSFFDFAGIDSYAPKWAKKIRVYYNGKQYTITFLK